MGTTVEAPEPLRVGIVGAGASARDNHIPAIAGHPAWRLVGITDVDKARTVELAAAADVSAYPSLGSMAQEVDAVVVAVPPEHHRRVVCTALGMGLHVLCEKPPAQSREEAADMADVAERAGRVLSYVLQHGARAYAYRGLCGGADRAAVTWLRPGHHDGPPLIPDLAPHVVHAGWLLLGQPRPEAAVCRVTPSGAVSGQVHLDGGAVLSLDLWTSPAIEHEHVSVTVDGPQVRATIPMLTQATPTTDASWWRAGARTVAPVYSEEDCFEALYHRFADACRGKADPLVTADDGVTLQAIIDGLMQSAERGGEPVSPLL